MPNEFKVVPYRWKSYQKAHKGHNKEEINPGQRVWAIRHKPTAYYFYYAYTSPTYAQTVCDRLPDEDRLSMSTSLLLEPQVVTARVSD